MRQWARFLAWLADHRAMRLARRKRALQQLCQDCGVSKAKAVQIASRYFNGVAK